ncbi:MAG TPA: hypothetical protein VFG07_08885 [Thermoplasmata archaeon]|nr:hypothetical protein [Thermoplasmata archaeon]
MTTMSALRASNAEPVPPTSTFTPVQGAGSAVRVLVPGTERTYENREVLRGMGLRWDPPTHAWHGILTHRERDHLRERFGLAVRAVVALESFPAGTETLSAPPSPPKPPRGPSPSTAATPNPETRLVAHDYSRTRAETRVAIRDTADDLADPWAPILGSRFSLRDVTSGLPDDSRDADERRGERALRELRERVKRARAVIATTPGLSEILAADPRRAAMFYARWGISRSRLLAGVPNVPDPLCRAGFGPQSPS